MGVVRFRHETLLLFQGAAFRNLSRDDPVEGLFIWEPSSLAIGLYRSRTEP